MSRHKLAQHVLLLLLLVCGLSRCLLLLIIPSQYKNEKNQERKEESIMDNRLDRMNNKYTANVAYYQDSTQLISPVLTSFSLRFVWFHRPNRWVYCSRAQPTEGRERERERERGERRERNGERENKGVEVEGRCWRYEDSEMCAQNVNYHEKSEVRVTYLLSVDLCVSLYCAFPPLHPVIFLEIQYYKTSNSVTYWRIRRKELIGT